MSLTDRKLADPGVLFVNSPKLVRRQAIALGPGAKTAIAILALLVVLLASGVLTLLCFRGDRALWGGRR